jgi:membrane-associated protein
MFPERWRRWGEDFVTRHGERAVFFARFLVGLRGFVYFAVGAARLSFLRFLGVNAAAALLDVGVLVTVGFAFGELRERHAALGPAIDVGVAALLALTLLAPLLTRRKFSREDGKTGS